MSGRKQSKMEGEACLYSKFGFCKYRDSCKRQHFKQICKDNSTCKSIKSCPKRHPKVCKRYATENGCRFGEKCSYKHQTSAKDQNASEEKVRQMEMVIRELVLKVTCLESELNTIKLDISNKSSVTDSNKDNESSENSKSISEEPLSSTNDSENTIEKLQEIHASELKCDKCEYVVNKKAH